MALWFRGLAPYRAIPPTQTPIAVTFAYVQNEVGGVSHVKLPSEGYRAIGGYSSYSIAVSRYTAPLRVGGLSPPFHQNTCVSEGTINTVAVQLWTHCDLPMLCRGVITVLCMSQTADLTQLASPCPTVAAGGASCVTPKVEQRLMGETKWEKGAETACCDFLRFPAVSCGFLQFSAAPNHLPCRSRTKSAKICENLRQAAVSPF